MSTYKLKRPTVVQPVGENYRLIPLTQGQVTKVSVEDFAELSEWNWYARWEQATQSFYAAKGSGGYITKMSRYIMQCEDDERVDHINRDSLDNRRENLRKCTAFQNQCNQAVRATNKSGYKGVSKFRDGRWVAQIRANRKHFSLGVYDKPEHAAIAYNVAAMLLHKEFAFINKV